MKRIVIRWDTYGFTVHVEQGTMVEEVYRMGHNMQSRLPLPMHPIFSQETLLKAAHTVAARACVDYGVDLSNIEWLGPSEQTASIIARTAAFHHAGRG